jgi:hypothetical protein
MFFFAVAVLAVPEKIALAVEKRFRCHSLCLILVWALRDDLLNVFHTIDGHPEIENFIFSFFAQS